MAEASSNFREFDERSVSRTSAGRLHRKKSRSQWFKRSGTPTKYSQSDPHGWLHYFETRLNFAAGLPHIWWDINVENRRYGVPRIDDLRDAAAQTRFLSIEPLLEVLGPSNLAGIHRVIVGGESGPGARPMERKWVFSRLNLSRPSV